MKAQVTIEEFGIAMSSLPPTAQTRVLIARMEAIRDFKVNYPDHATCDAAKSVAAQAATEVALISEGGLRVLGRA